MTSINYDFLQLNGTNGNERYTHFFCHELALVTKIHLSELKRKSRTITRFVDADVWMVTVLDNLFRNSKRVSLSSLSRSCGNDWLNEIIVMTDEYGVCICPNQLLNENAENERHGLIEAQSNSEIGECVHTLFSLSHALISVLSVECIFQILH